MVTSQAPIENGPAPFNLTAVDRAVLNTPESEYKPHTWEDLKQIIAQNDLAVLKRRPSDLARYIAWSSATKAAYDSIPNYICQRRLKWTPLSNTDPAAGPRFDYISPVPFVEKADYKILPNDWPYGFESGITHLVVWLKNRVPTVPPLGHMTEEGKAMVEDFVQKTFTDRVKDLPGPKEKILWFKNWTALQSVPGMEHVHVLVRGVPEEVILEWTEGEKPLQELNELKN